MSDWTKATPTSTEAGILRPDQLAQHVTVGRRPAAPGLDAWVENYWWLRWDLPAHTSYPSQTLPHPTCSLTTEHGSHPRPERGPDPVVLTGVVTRRFDVDVRGWGWIFGVKFRPGGFAAYAGGRACDWTDRVLPASTQCPAAVVDALREAGPSMPVEHVSWELDTALLAQAPPVDPRHQELLTVVQDMLEDRTLLSVAQVERRHGNSRRTLQRRFSHYVGVGPKWVLARYRLHDAVTELDAGYDGPLIDLAYAYGWYDQAHFIRDFVDLVGLTPGEYRSRGS